MFGALLGLTPGGFLSSLSILFTLYKKKILLSCGEEIMLQKKKKVRDPIPMISVAVPKLVKRGKNALYSKG